jgi:hypothetical protein
MNFADEQMLGESDVTSYYLRLIAAKKDERTSFPEKVLSLKALFARNGNRDVIPVKNRDNIPPALQILRSYKLICYGDRPKNREELLRSISLPMF